MVGQIGENLTRHRSLHRYADPEEAKAYLRKIGKPIVGGGNPRAIVPSVVCVLGYGNVAPGLA